MSKTVYLNADKSQGRAGTIVTAEALNAMNNHRHEGLDQDGSGAIDYAIDTGAANAYIIALTPALQVYTAGMPIWFQAAAANTGAATLNINGLGVKPIKKYGVDTLGAEEIRAGQIVCVVYDGVNFQLLSRGLAHQVDAVVNYAADTGAADAYTITLTPGIAEYVIGAPVLFLAGNTNTGPATLNVNGCGVKDVKKRGNLPLDAGDIVSGQIAVVIYDGANFQLLTPAFSNGVPVGTVITRISRRTPAGYIPYKPATLLRAQYAELFDFMVPHYAVTLPIGTPLIIPKPDHGLDIGDRVRFTTTGTLPTGITVGTDYYILAAGFTVDAFKISTTPIGAPIATSGAQDGVHTLFCWSVAGPGNGLTTFDILDPRGYFLRIWDGGRGLDSGRVFGSFQNDAIIDHTHPARGDVASNGVDGTGHQSRVGEFDTQGVKQPNNGGVETRPKNLALPAFIKY